MLTHIIPREPTALTGECLDSADHVRPTCGIQAHVVVSGPVQSRRSPIARFAHEKFVDPTNVAVVFVLRVWFVPNSNRVPYIEENTTNLGANASRIRFVDDGFRCFHQLLPSRQPEGPFCPEIDNFEKFAEHFKNARNILSKRLR